MLIKSTELLTEKFWRTIQVNAIGGEKFGEYATVSAYAKYIFGVSVNVGKKLMIYQICQFFPRQNFLVYFNMMQHCTSSKGGC